MRKIRNVLRLKYEVGLSHEKIAAATDLSKGAATNAVQRALREGLSWPLPADLDEGRLEAMLYRQAAPRSQYAQPEELKRKGVTLQLLWEEYEAAHGENAYRYSQFCVHYHAYRGTLARSMRQVRRAGEKVFIDYSGDAVAVIDPKSALIGRRSPSATGSNWPTCCALTQHLREPVPEAVLRGLQAKPLRSWGMFGAPGRTNFELSPGYAGRLGYVPRAVGTTLRSLEERPESFAGPPEMLRIRSVRAGMPDARGHLELPATLAHVRRWRKSAGQPIIGWKWMDKRRPLCHPLNGWDWRS